MQQVSQNYAPYTDVRKVELSFVFGVVAPEAAALAQPASSAQSVVSQIGNTTDDVEEMSGKYTSLENNMFILDGTMELYDTGDTQTGWQSADISQNDKAFSSEPWLQFTFSEPQDSYGFTLIFDNTQPDNYPSEIITTAYNAAGGVIGTVTTQPSGFLHVIDLAVQEYGSVKFEFVGTNIPGRRIRVCGVRFGINYSYDGSNIVSVSVRQSVSPWCESLPSAEVDATIDNTDQLYNMVNPTGLYAYLQDGQYMTWQIDVNGEAVDMGLAYFTSADSEDGSMTTKITFNDRLLVMDDMEYNGGTSGTWTLQAAIAAILSASGTGITATFEGSLGSTVIGKQIPQGTSIRESIRLCAQAAMCTCYMDRSNTLHFFTPSVGTPSDEWTLDVQSEMPQIKVGKLYNTVILTVSDGYTEDAESQVFTAQNIAPGDFERAYEVSNPVVNDGNAVAQWILGWVERRVTYDAAMRGNPALDLLDTVQIDDAYSVNGNALITELNYTYDGGLDCDATAIR